MSGELGPLAAVLEAVRRYEAATPGPPSRIRVSRALYDRMRREAPPVVDAPAFMVRVPHGIPIVVDDGLDGDQWRADYGPMGL